MNEGGIRKRVVLLNGSPKPGGGTSGVLGEYLLGKLRESGLETEALSAARAIRSAGEMEKLLAALASSDLMVLVSPVYVDSLPYPVIKALEEIAEYLGGKARRKKRGFAAITNCGFPEALHNDTALEICRCFAGDAGFEWAGGLGLGGGQALEGRPLEKSGFLVRHVRKALDLAAEALAVGGVIPAEAGSLFSKRLMPVWVYLSVGEYGWKRQARKHGAEGKMRDRPYCS